MQRLVLPGSLLTVVCLLGGCKEEPKKAPVAPPPQVDVATVLQRDVPVYIEAIGETRGNTEIEIRARVEGFVESVDYKEGSLVKKDQLLYTIDSRPFEANLAQATANQAQAEANLARARQDVVRYEPLVAKNAISREEYDTAVALEKSAKAAVDAAKAVVRQSEIDLSYTKVVAPEDGLAGRTEVYAGTLVGRGQSTLLTRISRLDPIHVRFSFPEKDYMTLARKRAQSPRPADDPGPPFELLMPDGTVHSEPGRLVYVDRNVDARTGTIMAEAAFPNPGQLLRPGQYVRARATIGTRTGAILVPQRAVVELQGIFSVMVVNQDDTVEQRLVTPAERIGSLWVIGSGLKSAERIIVEGLQKARPGIKVNAKPVQIEEKGKKTGSATDEASMDEPEPPAKTEEKAPPAKPEEKH